jgi:Zn-dependent protease
MDGDIMDFLPYVISFIAFLISITIHEFSHALAATLLGDMTAKRLGRLTLNPLSHIDPVGLLFLILIRIGWAKPVPFNADNFTYPRLYSILVALAGPCSNFILALACLYGQEYLTGLVSSNVAILLTMFFKTSVWINVMLGVFNLLPFPPLDGSHFILMLIPEDWQAAYYRLSPFSIIILFVLLSIPAFQ